MSSLNFISPIDFIQKLSFAVSFSSDIVHEIRFRWRFFGFIRSTFPLFLPFVCNYQARTFSFRSDGFYRTICSWNGYRCLNALAFAYYMYIPMACSQTMKTTEKLQAYFSPPRLNPSPKNLCVPDPESVGVYLCMRACVEVYYCAVLV